jgi:hypothetical protein
MHWESPTFTGAKDRLEIAVSGGANFLSVDA